MNELIETMFYEFLTDSEDAKNLYDTREALDVDAMRTAFYAGYEAAEKVQRVRILHAMRQQHTAQRA